MKKQLFVLFLTLGAFSSAYSGWTKDNPYQRPNPGLTFDQVAWLASHNSFTNTIVPKFGSTDYWIYGQQHWTIEEQLENGVRALMLDIHEFDKGKCKLKDCLGNCEITKKTREAGCKIVTVFFSPKKDCKNLYKCNKAYGGKCRNRCKALVFNQLINECKSNCNKDKKNCKDKKNKCLRNSRENKMTDCMADCDKGCEKAHKPSGSGPVLLCHGEKHVACCGKFAQQKFGFGIGDKKFNTFKWSLETIKKWLDQNPQEVVTIFLEQYVSNSKVNSIIESTGLGNMVLTEKDWNPHQHGGAWPTLQWMIDNNKRVLVYGTRGFDGYLRDLWSEVAESQYGEVTAKKACPLRSEPKKDKFAGPRSKINYLVALNFFKSIASEIETAKHNKYKTLKNLYETCKGLGVEGSLRNGNPPNYLGLDFANEGNPMKLINEWNAEAARKIVPQQ